MSERILIVDDESSIVESLTLVLKYEKYEVDSAIDGFSALTKVTENDYDLILLDIKMPGMDGLEVLEKIKVIKPEPVVIMISGHGTVETAVEATKKGAYSFLEKPLPDLPALKLTLKNAIEYKKSKDELIKLRNELLLSNELIGNSVAIENIKSLVEKYKDLDLNILITGESGTGKSLIANLIHLKSNRNNFPYVIINCAALRKVNAEEELFGSFVNEVIIKGKFEEAENGTILFDEVSNLNVDIQSKLLKVIEEGKFNRVGQGTEIKCNIRFLFSTNKDLTEEIVQGRFREDFYHRINVMNINVPPLRERSQDIEELVKYFTNIVSKNYDLEPKTFNKDALKRLSAFRFPGNVRELKNLVERIIFTVESSEITADDIEVPETKHSKELNDLLNKNLSLNDFQNQSERMFLLKMLADYKYNISQTAAALNIQRSHIYKLMTKYDIPTPSKIK